MMQDTGYTIQDARYRIQDARFRMTDKKNIVHRASCIVYRDRDGVTLVELIIVIAIIGIIVLFATIDTGWFQKDARVAEYRDKLLADIEDAKLKSIAKVPHGIIITNTSYKMVCLKEGNCNTTPGTACCQDSDCPSGEYCTFPSTVNFRKDSGQTCPTACSDILNSNVDLRTGMRISGPTNSELWFDRKGLPRLNTWAQLGTTFTLWYDDDGEGDADEPHKTITISNEGRIQYEQ